MAWLHAIPQPEVPKHRSVAAGDLPAPVSRLRGIQEKGGEPLLPDVDAGDYLLGYLLEIGPVQQSGMGPIPLSHGDLRDWQHNTGIDLEAWECSCLYRLSRDWLAEARNAEKPDCPAPWGDPAMEFDRDIVAQKITSAFKARLRGHSKGKQ